MHQMEQHPTTTRRVTGSVYLTNKTARNLEEVGFGHEVVYVRANHLYTDSEGYYELADVTCVQSELQGHHAQVSDRRRERNGDAQMKHMGEPDFNWNESLGIGEEHPDFGSLMAYFHVTDARRKCGALIGEDTLTQLDEGRWLRALRVVVNEDHDCYRRRACWNRLDSALYYGEAVSWVCDAIVTFHEYAHAIIDMFTQDEFFPIWEYAANSREREAASICEALADYLACSMKDYHKLLESLPQERDLSTSHVYAGPTDVYTDSLAASSALWELRREIGGDIVDTYILEILRRLRVSREKIRGFGFSQLLKLLVDVDLSEQGWGNSNGPVIIAVFQKHGIVLSRPRT